MITIVLGYFPTDFASDLFGFGPKFGGVWLVIMLGEGRMRQTFHSLRSERETGTDYSVKDGGGGGVDVRPKRRRRNCVTIANVRVNLL